MISAGRPAGPVSVDTAPTRSRVYVRLADIGMGLPIGPKHVL